MGEGLQQVLVCNSCQKDISLPVDFLEGNFTAPDFAQKIQEDAVFPGSAINIRFMVWHPEGKDVLEERAWMNLIDIVGFTDLDRGRAYGCCGPNGDINTRCRCGVLIGRYYGDCLMAHYFSPEPDLTQFMPFIEDEWERESMKRDRLYAANKKAKVQRKSHRKLK